MTDELKKLCNDYLQYHITLLAFRQRLKSLIDSAKQADMKDFAEFILDSLDHDLH